jgi:hypothetical protein
MENHSASAVLGPRAATPFEKDLTVRCGSGTNYHAVGSPSLPNYLGATSGSIQGVHDDARPSTHPIDSDNLFRQVRAAQQSARSYEEAMTQNCQPRAALGRMHLLAVAVGHDRAVDVSFRPTTQPGQHRRPGCP